MYMRGHLDPIWDNYTKQANQCQRIERYILVILSYKAGFY